MANQKISELDPAAAPTGAELVPVVQGGFTVKSTLTAIANWVYGLTGLSTSYSAVDGSELISCVQGGTAKKGSLSVIADWVQKTFPGFVQSGVGAVARPMQDKMRELKSAKDFGAILDGASHPLSNFYGTLAEAQEKYPHAVALTDEIDGVAIQACINAGYVCDIGYGVGLTSHDIVVVDGTGIIGRSAFWKRRTGYVYSAARHSVIKYVGAGGVNSGVVRASATPVGTVGTDFSGPDTDDLLCVTMRDFHVDAGGLADYGVYVYRAGNQATIGNITAEKAVKANHVHLGCYAAIFGTFGAYECVDTGVICGWDIFSWGSVEATNFAYTATFLTANNGTGNTYVSGTGTDLDNSGGKFSAGRGSRVFIKSESNKGRACLLSQYNTAGAAGGPSDYYLDYIEGNGDGPYVDYRDAMDAIRLRCGFMHPGNGSTLLSQNIKIDGKNNSGVTTTDSGPTTSSEWLIVEGGMGDLAGAGFSINSNTYKYHVMDCTANVLFTASLPAVVKNSDNQVGAAVYFTAAASPTVWKAINGTLARSSVGTYVFTFKHRFKTSGAVIPQISVIIDAGSPYDTEARISSLSDTSVTIRVYDSANALADTGDRISLSFVGDLL